MKKITALLVLLLIVGIVSERLNKKKLRDNTKNINLLEQSNSLLIAENRQIKSDLFDMWKELKPFSWKRSL